MAGIPLPQQSPLFAALSQALVHARAAVSADSKGEISKAIAQYKESVNILVAEEGKNHKISQEHAAMILERAEIYRNRIASLENALASSKIEKSGKTSKSESKIAFTEEPPIGLPPDPPPASPSFKAFWLMRAWAKTIGSGGYLTPNLFIPKSLWLTPGCKFAALQTKLSSCEALLDSLGKMRDTVLDNVELLDRELDTFCAQLDSLQNSLHFHLSFIAEVKKEEKKDTTVSRLKKIGETVAKGAVRLAPSQRQEGSDYILLLKSVFEESQFFEDWIAHFLKSNHTHIQARLRRVSDFYLEVVCQFVIRDFNSLAERYIKKSAAAFMKFSLK